MTAPPTHYSPYPVESYFITGLPPQKFNYDPLRTLVGMPRADALWNWAWLNNPDLDKLSGATQLEAFAMYGSQVENWLTTSNSDVFEDEVLYRKLLMSPVHFHSWFTAIDPITFNAYNFFGGEKWVEVVQARLVAAADRRISSMDRVVYVKDNMIKVDFTRMGIPA